MLKSISYFRLGEWLVKPSENAFENGDIRSVVEPRAMNVLVTMAQEPGTIFTSEQLLNACWAGTFYGDNPVHKAIAQLRKALKDRASQPAYIETIRKRGYRLIASVSFPDQAHRPADTVWASGSPYLGLEAFDRRHADVFFGRGEATTELIKRIKQQLQAGKPFELILGPSGSGKTSLIHAGILPLLTAEHGVEEIRALDAVTMGMGTPQASEPVTALVDTLLQWRLGNRSIFSLNNRSDLYQAILSRQFDTLLEPITRIIKQYRDTQHLHDTDTHVVLTLVIDQFEKLCTNPDIDEQQKNALLDAIQYLVQSGLVLVLAASRNDFYPEIMRLKHVTELKSGNGQFDLLPPSSGEISEMIRKPAMAAGLSFEQDPDSLIKLDDQIRDDAITHPDILPLLQYTLNELYLNRSQDNCLCFDTYRSMGGLEGALSQKVATVVDSLDEGAQDCLDNLLGRLVILRADGAVSSRPADWDQITDTKELELTQALIDSRLLTSERNDDRHTVSVTHEALFTHWPRAQRWIEKNQELLRSYTNVSAAASRWHEEGQSADYLLSGGKPLLEARQLIGNDQLQLEEQDKAFIQASLKQAGKRSQIRRLALATVVGLGVVAGIAAFIATEARRSAEQRQAQAEGLVGFMLGDLMDRLRPIGRLNLLDVVGDEAMRYLESQQGDAVGRDALLLRAQALIQIGEIRITQGDLSSARAAFMEADSILNTLMDKWSVDGPTLLQAGNVNYWLGYLHYQQNDLEAAGEKWHNYQVYAEQWAILEPDNLKAKTELSYAWNNLGTLANIAGQLDKASQFFEQSTALKQEVVSSKPDDIPLNIDLANGYSWIARSAKTNGRLDKAQDYFQRELDLLSNLYQVAHNDNQVLYRLVVAKQNAGSIARARGDTQKAIDIYESATQHIRSLINTDASNKQWQTAYAYLASRLGMAYYELDNLSAAEQQLQLAQHQMQELTLSNEKNVEWKRSLQNANYRLAQTKQAMRQQSTAMALLETTLSNTRQLFENNQDDLLTRTLLTEILVTQGEWVCATDSAAATDIWQSVVTLLQPVAADTKDTRILAPLFMAKSNLGHDTTSITSLFQQMEYQPLILSDYFNNNRENPLCRTQAHTT